MSAVQVGGVRPPSGYKADRGRTYGEIERVMRQIRAVLRPGCQPFEQLPIMDVFEHLHEHSVMTLSRAVSLDWGVVELPYGVEGRTRYDEDRDQIVIEISTQTYEGLENGHGRAIITVGHEISHAALHPDQLIRISQIPHAQMALARATGPRHRHFEDTEWQANAGAVALTMPAEGLAYLERYGGLTPARVQAAFGVSASAAQNRINCFMQRRADLLR